MRDETLDPPDEELMARVRAGDGAAFEAVYRRHKDRVFGYLWRVCGDEAVADDLHQEVFVRLWQARDRWTSSGSLAGYLLRTARNLSLNQHRNQDTRSRAHLELQASGTRAPAPDAVLRERDLARRVNEAIDALPERPREVFVLKRDASLTYREIGELLGISPKTVEVHMGKALRLLRERLSDLRS
jgi:RNA polymerase sigma-70 factor, ECF subfamily